MNVTKNLTKVAPEQAGLDAGKLEWITDHINKNYIEPGKIAGCQVYVNRHGHTGYFRSFGMKDAERVAPMTDDTIFRLYSMTKPIVSVALMQLFEKGYFQLNDPVHRFIPSWKNHEVWVSGSGADMVTRPPRSPMTMKHILSHTGGITYGGDRNEVDKAYREHGVTRQNGQTLTSFLDSLAKVPLRFDPGEQWLYSLSTDVCGGLVEIISGQKLDDYLAEHIFQPLDMIDTGFYVAKDSHERFAANYTRRKDKTLQLLDDPLTSAYLEPNTFLSGGGGLVGTMADYAKFTEMLRCGGAYGGKHIIGSRTLRLMRQNHLKGNSDLTDLSIGSFSETAYEGIGFGLGFAVTMGQREAASVSTQDFYWGGAASTIFWVDPVEDMSVIFMTQIMPSTSFNFRGQLKNIIYGAITD